ncbi:MAG: hypothetical protein ACRD0C_07275, partial [Acidimicrobiia bacterium]
MAGVVLKEPPAEAGDDPLAAVDQDGRDHRPGKGLLADVGDVAGAGGAEGLHDLGHLEELRPPAHAPSVT